jgi:MFS family permease
MNRPAFHTPRVASARSRLPTGVWALGFVSLFMDISSEMIHGLLPVFLVGSLGVSVAALGLIEGVAESAATIMKLFSGVWSDRLGRRKPLAVLGYGMAALTKPFFPLAEGVATIFAARFIDRIGKGIRGAPRDALVADLTSPAQRGAAYGLRQTLDTLGALIGPLLAMGLMILTAGSVRSVFWFATLPAVVAVALLVFAVREPEQSRPPPARGNPFAGFRWRLFPPSFWRLVAVAALFTLARFSEAFLVLRVLATGLPEAYAPVALVVMNLAYVLSTYPAGVLSDRWSRHGLLVVGCLVMVVADLLLAFGGSTTLVFIGIAAWGLHMGLTEGLLAALTADRAPVELRGTAFGVVSLVRGVMLLVASVLAGVLWSKFGASVTFGVGAAFALLTAIAAASLRDRAKRVVQQGP